MLRTSSFVANDPSTEALKRELREAGYVEGQNIKIVRRFAEGQLDRLPQLAQDLVQLRVDIILAPNHAAVRAAKQVTTTIPIVMVLYDSDPVASGLIRSLNHPGSNVTGIFSLQPELSGKRLQLLKETLPGLPRVAVFHDANNLGSIDELEAAARSPAATADRAAFGGRAPVGVQVCSG